MVGKENSRAVLLYYFDCQVVEILTTHLIHYLIQGYNYF